MLFDKGYYPDTSGRYEGTYVQLRYEGIGLDFIPFDGSVSDIKTRLESRLNGMVAYYGSLDSNDIKFLAERLYLGEGIMLNLNGRDGLVYLGSHRTHRNFIDKFSL